MAEERNPYNLEEVLKDAQKWRGLHPESLERRALYLLEKYNDKKDWIDQALTMSGEDLIRFVGREPEALNLQQIIDRIGKPVFEKDAAGRKCWRIIKELRLEKQGLYITFTDGCEIWHQWTDELNFLFGKETE